MPSRSSLRPGPHVYVVVLFVSSWLAACALSHEPTELDASTDALRSDALDALDARRPDVPPIDVPRDGLDVQRDVPPDRTACDATCDGACYDLQSDVHHCGACGNDCTQRANVNTNAVRCLSGVCSITGACIPAFGDCTGGEADGCETPINTAQHCGGCNVTCPTDMPTCRPATSDASAAAFVCDTGCAPGQTLCSSVCTDLQTDKANCHGCNMACQDPANGVNNCVAGACQITCGSGFHRCGMACKADDDATACGATCTSCGNGPANGSAICSSGVCTPVCNTGFHMCGNNCVSDTATGSCGTSCAACPTPSHSSATCDGTQCGIACDPNYHACSDNTCASDTDTARCTSSCTPCGTVAHGTGSCAANACVAACDPGWSANGYACQMSDTCTSPIDIPLTKNVAVTINGNSDTLANDYQPPRSCGTGAGPDAIFHVTARAAGTIDITLQPSGQWSGALYVDNTCGGGGLQCDASGSPGASAMVSVTSSGAGDTGYITVDGVAAGDHGDFVLTILLH